MILIRFIRIHVLFVFIAMCLFTAISWGTPVSPSVPLHSWVYPALDKLAGMGFIESGIDGNRPYTRMEAARRVQEVDRQLKKAEENQPSSNHRSTPHYAGCRRVIIQTKKGIRF